MLLSLDASTCGTKVQGELLDLPALSMPWKDVPLPWAWPGGADAIEVAVESMT